MHSSRLMHRRGYLSSPVLLYQITQDTSLSPPCAQALRDVRDASVRESEALQAAENEREVAEEAVLQLAEAQAEAAEARGNLAATTLQLKVSPSHKP